MYVYVCVCMCCALFVRCDVLCMCVICVCACIGVGVGFSTCRKIKNTRKIINTHVPCLLGFIHGMCLRGVHCLCCMFCICIVCVFLVVLGHEVDIDLVHVPYVWLPTKIEDMFVNK